MIAEHVNWHQFTLERPPSNDDECDCCGREVWVCRCPIINEELYAYGQAGSEDNGNRR